MIRFLCVLMAVAVLTVLGCAEQQSAPANTAQLPVETNTPARTPGPEGSVRGQPRFVSSNLPRDTSPGVAPEDVAQVVEGNTEFAFKLYQSLAGSPEFNGKNLFYSPFSISSALAMTYAGARGETERQMADVLGFDVSQEQLHAAFNLLDQKLTGNQKFDLEIASSLWGQDGFPFKQEFLDLLASNYGAGMRLVDYSGPSSREAARQAINDWVEEATKERIRDVVPEDFLDELTRLVLANAIYFKADWLYKFPKGATSDRPFHLLDGNEVSVPTMEHSHIPLRYAELDGLRAIELRYEGTPVSMIVILPERGGFADVERNLGGPLVHEVVQAIEKVNPKVVILRMPKFEFTSEARLRDALLKTGMSDAFDPGRADFSGIADPSSTRGKLYIKDAVHKAFIKVDEEGTEAAAATAVGEFDTSLPEELDIDRPFIFLIRDGVTGTVLFVGRVLDPRPDSNQR